MAHSTSTISSKAGGRGGRKVGVAPPPRRLAPPDDEDTTIDIYGSSAASPPAKSSDRRSSGSERPSHTMFAAVVALLVVIGLIVVVVLGATGNLGSGSDGKTSNIDPKTFEGTEECSSVMEILPEYGSDGLHFGSTVAVQGDTAVIGAYNDDTGMGSVYVFTREKNKRWKEEANFHLGLGSVGDPNSESFGSSLALDGDTFIVGKPNDDIDGDWSGSALVFRHTSDKNFPWQREGLLRPWRQEERDYFGQSVGLRSDTAIVGASCNIVGVNSGAAFIFRRYPGSSFWEQEAKLVPGEDGKDGSSNDEFGKSVALSGDGNVAFVGSWLDADSQNQSMGSVYIYRRTAVGIWEQEDRLLPPHGEFDTTFGKSLAVNDDFVVIGSPGSPWEPHSVGAAYVYRLQNHHWSLYGILRSVYGDMSHSFGEYVAIDGDAIVVSSRTNGFQEAGLSVFLRDGNQWVLHNVLQPDPSRVSGIGFASSIATDGPTLLVGARNADIKEGVDAGAAYSFGCGST